MKNVNSAVAPIKKSEIRGYRYSKRLLYVAVIGTAALSVFLTWSRPESLSLGASMLALGIIWASLFPCFHYLVERDRPPVPFVPLIGLFYAANFGLPAFYSRTVPNSITGEEVSDQALLLTLCGMILLSCFYYPARRIFGGIRPLKISRSYSLGRLQGLLWFLVISRTASLFIPSLKELPSVGSFLGYATYTAYGTFFILWRRGRLPRLQAWLLWGVFFPLEIVDRFASAALAKVMLFGLFMLIMLWYETRRVPWVLIGVVLAFFVLLEPIKHDYRRLIWYGGPLSQASGIEKSKMFVDLALDYYSNTDSRDYALLTASAQSRTGSLFIFSTVVQSTPDAVPYWNGESYKPLFSKFIPRILWADKPEERFGQEFGHRYGFIMPEDHETSVNLPWIVEMYGNFGRFGVMVGMALSGLLFALLEAKLNRTEMGPLEFVIGATVLFELIYQESNFSLMVGNVRSAAACLYAYFYFGLARSK